MKASRIVSPLFVLLLLFGALLAACAPAPATQKVAPPAAEPGPTQTTEAKQEYEDTLILVANQDPTLLDPAVVYDGSDRITRLMYETLVEYEGSSVAELKPHLATEWSVSDDGLVYTFKLREGVTFHDGTPFNADAVKFSFDRAMKIGKGFTWAFGPILDEVKVADPMTVEFHLKRVYPSFLYMLANRYASPIVSPSIMEHEKEGDLAEDWMKENAIGTGPYMLTKWTRGEEVLLDYYPDYWQGWTDRNIKHVVYKSLVDPATERQMLERGEAHSATYISIEDLHAMEPNPDIKIVQAEPGTSNFNWFILFNTRKGIFADKRAREALSWAFPYEGCVEVAFEGLANQSVGPLPTGSPDHGGDQLFMYHQDMDKAKEILGELGLLDSGQTIRVTYGDHEWGNKLLELLSTTLAELGFKVEAMPLGWSAMFEDMANQETAPDIVIGDWWDDYPDSYSGLGGIADWFWWGSGREEADYFYYNAEVQRLLQEGDLLTDPAERKEAIARAQELIIEDIPAIWAFDYLYAMPMRKNLHGYVWNPYYIMTYNVYDMYIEKE